MNIEFIQLIIDYIDAAIEYALASQEIGADGYTFSHPNERNALEDAKKCLLAFQENIDYKGYRLDVQSKILSKY